MATPAKTATVNKTNPANAPAGSPALPAQAVAAAQSAAPNPALEPPPNTAADSANAQPSAAEKPAPESAELVAVAESPERALENAMEAGLEVGLVERQSLEARLPVQLDVGIPIRDFRVRNLLALERGSLVQSQWVPGEDVPVSSGDVQLAWSEFEVVEAQLAVRLTRLA